MEASKGCKWDLGVFLCEADYESHLTSIPKNSWTESIADEVSKYHSHLQIGNAGHLGEENVS